jgi:hypothetical protein
MAKDRYTAQEVIEALQETRGLRALAAKRLGCHVGTVDNYVRRYKSVAAVIEQEREAMLDLAEAKLLSAINSGEAWAVCFFLKTQGKKRQYTERVQVTGENGAPLVPTTVTLRVEAAHVSAALAALADAGAVKLLEGAK